MALRKKVKDETKIEQTEQAVEGQKLLWKRRM